MGRVRHEGGGFEDSNGAGREVMRKDPPPWPVVGDPAAEGRAEDRAQHDPDAPERHRHPPLTEGEDLPEDRLRDRDRSEEHTSELQSLAYLVCRLLLEKKKKKND